MQRALAHRILGVATRIAGSRISFDEFIKDVTSAHIGLLKATDDLESVRDLLVRSGHQSPAERLEKVQQDLDFALGALRTLDALYHTGKLRYGPRAPQVRRKQTAGEMESSQQKPSPARSTRKLLR